MRTLERHYLKLRDWPIVQNAEAVDVTGAARWAWAEDKNADDEESIYEFPAVTSPYPALWMEYGDIREVSQTRSRMDVDAEDGFTMFNYPLIRPGRWRGAAIVSCREFDAEEGETSLRQYAHRKELRTLFPKYKTDDDYNREFWAGKNYPEHLHYEDGNHLADVGNRARWLLTMLVLYDSSVAGLLVDYGVVSALLDDKGIVLLAEAAYSPALLQLTTGLGIRLIGDQRALLWRYAVPFFFALSLMNAKNVSLVDVPLPPKVAKRREKDGKPVLKFKTLHIEPMRQRVKREKQPGENEVKVALHLCRGHFKDYRNSGGLFGKYKGLYWWDSQVRGTDEAGRIIKDYALGAPKA